MSSDFLVGCPFNTTQYAVLTHLLAQSTGLKVGKLTHVINNCHIYENQLEGAKKLLDNYSKLDELAYRIYICGDYSLDTTEKQHIYEVFLNNPKLVLNPDIENFYDFTLDDIKLENYKHMGNIKFPVAV